MQIFEIILIILLSLLSISSIIYIVYYKKQLKTQNKELEDIKNSAASIRNQALEEIDNYQKIEQKHIQLNKDIDNLNIEKKILNNSIDNLKEQEKILNTTLENKLEHDELILTKSFSNYSAALEKEYQIKEQEYDKLTRTLYQKYNEAQDKCSNDFLNFKIECNAEMAKLQADLDKIRATRAAAIEAQKKEEEIKQQLSFYCLTVTKSELNDIVKLENVKLQLNNPRILSMLIWSTFFQKPMNTLCANVLGTKTVCGIYKITNQKTGLCYIGQSVDIAKRWKDHAKCGLGIDAPAGNKLYKAMQECGIWNFSWELLEACPKEQLDEKEKFYISLYQTKDYGYNIVKGNG